jgi:hypothetical protein
VHAFACTKSRVGIFVCCNISRAGHVFICVGVFQGLCVYLHVSACVCMYQMLGVYVHTLRAGQCKHISRAGHVFSCVGTYQKLRV